MANDHIANIAITVTAAMLATAAVAFTLSGNAPTDPRAADLPVISVGAAEARAATTGATAPAQPPASSSSVASKPSGSSAAVASDHSASAIAGGASSTAPSDGASHDSDHDGDSHEVVVPTVHESDEHDRKVKNTSGTKGSGTSERD